MIRVDCEVMVGWAAPPLSPTSPRLSPLGPPPPPPAPYLGRLQPRALWWPPRQACGGRRRKP